jgi:tetratricopeptide (TPR) repeat protein
MADVSADRYMPPWKPEPNYGPALVGSRGLSATELAVLRSWADDGAPSGDLSLTPEPPPPPRDGWTLGEPDLVLQATEAYQLGAAGSDVFRNFVLSLPLDRRRYVRAVEFLPESRNAIHHAVMALDPTPGSRARDAADPGPGFDSMDLGQAINPNGHIIGWTPGQIPYEVFPGTAWELAPGTDLILQLHLVPTGRSEFIRPRIGLYFTEESPSVTSTVIQLREYDLDIPAGAVAHEIEETFTLPTSVRVLGLYPHAHYLGKDLRVLAELPDGRQQGLIRIPDWDFAWQSDYRFVEPLRLPAGSRIVMRYSYDNSASNPRNPSRPPQRVKAGWRSADEMGEVAIQLLLDRPSDRLLLDEAQARYDLASGVATATSWYNLALALDYQDRNAEAEAAYTRALTLDPTLAKAVNNLGVLAEQRGDHTAALRHYQAARTADPHAIETRLNLARLLARQGGIAEARPLLQDALRDQPRHLRVRLSLADLLVAARDAATARSLLDTTPVDLAGDARVLLRRGKLLALAGEVAKARAVLAQAAVAPVFDDEHVDRLTRESRAEARYNLAILAQGTGSLAAVSAELETALSLWPEHPDSLLMSLAVAGARGDHPNQRRLLDRLLVLPTERQFSHSTLLEFLPGASGAVLLADALDRKGEHAAARATIVTALASARTQAQVSAVQELEAWLKNHTTHTR